MRPVELMEVLEARERRVQRQNELLQRFRAPLVCFTMNIAGPVKNSDQILWAFRFGCRLVRRQLDRCRIKLLCLETYEEVTGNEACFAAEADPVRLKQLMVELEEKLELGRLFDLDVLTPEGRKLERNTERCCLICGARGKSCARSRTHTVEELQNKTQAIIKAARMRWKQDTVSELACRALLYEACTTPKPGLVDCRNSGSHTDMDLFSFLSSAASLQPYFAGCVQIGMETAGQSPAATFDALRWPGKFAELRMLEVTNGVNTHKGAIFTMGVLCGALGRLDDRVWNDPACILRECAAMTCGITERELIADQTGETAGEQLFCRFGAMGVRGQMEAGLPDVLNSGLPVLERELQKGCSIETAGCTALLSLIAAAEDTNLLKRGGQDGLKWAAEEAERLLENAPDRRMLEALDDAFIAKNLSPGGAADLLAVCYFLYFLKNEC